MRGARLLYMHQNIWAQIPFYTVLVKFAIRFYSTQYMHTVCACAYRLYTHTYLLYYFYSSLLHVIVAHMWCTQEKERRREQKEREGVSTNPWRPCFCICKERTRTLRRTRSWVQNRQTRRTGTEQNAVARALLWCSLPVKSVACLCCSSL